MTRAAVFVAEGQPIEVRDIDVMAPKAGELRVRLAASGICHSDLTVYERKVALFPIPIVLGHEGAGVVTEIGDGVRGFAPGDHVVLSCIPQCGECFYCRREAWTSCETAAGMFSGGLIDGTSRLRMDGETLFQFGCAGTFAEETIVPATSLVKIDADVPLDLACLIGCCVATGYGAVHNVAGLRPGDVAAVIGCGGVGLNVIQTAVLAGASRVIAVDTSTRHLDAARAFGATDLVNVSDGDPVLAVLDLTDGRGVDIGFEAAGTPQTIEQVINLTRRQGQSVFVGVPDMATMLSVPMTFGLIAPGKTLKGCFYGAVNSRRDFTALVDLYQAGRLRLEGLVSQRIGLEEVNEAFAAMERGDVIRSVIVYD